MISTAIPASRTVVPGDVNLVIDPELRACVPEPLIREAKHVAKADGMRQCCDAAEMQRRNLSKLIEIRGVERPVYLWDREGDLVIVDGIKTYLAACEQNKPFEIRTLKFQNLEEAKAFRWYVNIAAAGRPSEDAAVWAFLEQYDWMVQQWRSEGRQNQGKQSLFLDSEKVNWRLRAAEMCQTTKSRIDAVYDLRREAKAVSRFSEDDRKDWTPEEVARVKMIEDGVKTVLSGARAASSVVSDIKGGQSRSGKKNKGAVNRVDNAPPKRHEPSDIEDHRIVVADSLECIQSLPDNSFKYLIGSPPYYSAAIDYGIEIPWCEDWESYCQAMEVYLTQAYRIVPPGGGVILNVDDTRDRESHRYYYHSELITKICLGLGMYDAGRICWSKQNVAGKKHAKGSNRKLATRPNHEYVLAFFKGRPEVDIPSFVFGEANHLTLSTWIEDTDVEEINADHWAMFSNFWEIAPTHHAQHPAVYPAKLAYRMLTRFTGAGDIVCDPWTGTATTGVQCVATGRRFLGIEHGSGYAEIAIGNLKRAVETTNMMSVQRLLEIERYLKAKFDDEVAVEKITHSEALQI